MLVTLEVPLLIYRSQKVWTGWKYGQVEPPEVKVINPFIYTRV